MSKKKKISVTMTLDPEVVAYLDEWRQSQKFTSPRNVVVENLITDFLIEQAKTKNRKDKPS